MLFDSIVFLIVVVFFFFFFYTSAVLIARHVAVCKDDFSFSFFSSCPAKNITRDGAVLSDTCYESSRGVTPSSQVVFIVGDAKKPVCLNLFLCVCFFFFSEMEKCGRREFSKVVHKHMQPAQRGTIDKKKQRNLPWRRTSRSVCARNTFSLKSIKKRLARHIGKISQSSPATGCAIF